MAYATALCQCRLRILSNTFNNIVIGIKGNLPAQRSFSGTVVIQRTYHLKFGQFISIYIERQSSFGNNVIHRSAERLFQKLISSTLGKQLHTYAQCTHTRTHQDVYHHPTQMDKPNKQWNAQLQTS